MRSSSVEDAMISQIATPSDGAESLGEQLADWVGLMQEYFHVWSEVHTPLGIILDPHTQSVAVVRRGLLSLVRKGDVADDLCSPSSPNVPMQSRKPIELLQVRFGLID
jgi:hypothetical protein